MAPTAIKDLQLRLFTPCLHPGHETIIWLPAAQDTDTRRRVPCPGRAITRSRSCRQPSVVRSDETAHNPVRRLSQRPVLLRLVISRPAVILNNGSTVDTLIDEAFLVACLPASPGVVTARQVRSPTPRGLGARQATYVAASRQHERRWCYLALPTTSLASDGRRATTTHHPPAPMWPGRRHPLSTLR